MWTLLGGHEGLGSDPIVVWCDIQNTGRVREMCDGYLWRMFRMFLLFKVANEVFLFFSLSSI